MSTRATISPSYRWRIGIVGLAAVAFGCWFIYDWKIGYPAKQALYNEYQSVVAPEGDGKLLGNYQQAWHEYATAKGYSTSEPKEVSDRDIETQLYYGLPCFLVGIPFVVSCLLMGRRFVEVDDEQVWDHKGRKATWDQITHIDKSRWATKGIAVIEYKAEGVTKRITLDDWKYDRAATQSILAQVEAKTAGGEVAEAPATEADAPAPEVA